MKQRQKQVLFVNAAGATLYRRSGHEAKAIERFGADDGGYARFAALIDAAPDATTFIVVDLLEEEYQLTTVPHVSALSRDHKALMDRQAERTLRGAAYRYWEVQGRDSQGRRDDKVLFTGIANVDILKPWLKPIEDKQASLGGIVSLPLLSKLLLPALDKTTGTQLLVTKVADNLRLSVFADGLLKVSRITPLRHSTSTIMAETFIREVEKTQMYLGRVRLLGQTGRINVWVVGQGMLLELVRCETRDSDAMVWHMLDVSALAEKARLPGTWDTFDCEALFAQLLLQRAPINHYATPALRRAEKLRRHDRHLRYAGAALLAVASGLSAWNVAGGLQLEDRRSEVAAQTVSLQLAYGAIEKTLPPDLSVDTDDMHAMVQAAAKLNDLKATPTAILRAISTALDAHAPVVLDRVHFKVLTPDIRQTEFNPQADPLAEPEAQETFDDAGRYAVEEVVKLGGHLARFDNDFRAAHTALLAFASSLQSSGAFKRVKVLKEPVSTSPASALEGSYGARDENVQGEFEIEVAWERRYDP